MVTIALCVRGARAEGESSPHTRTMMRVPALAMALFLLTMHMQCFADAAASSGPSGGHFRNEDGELVYFSSEHEGEKAKFRRSRAACNTITLNPLVNKSNRGLIDPRMRDYLLRRVGELDGDESVDEPRVSNLQPIEKSSLTGKVFPTVNREDHYPRRMMEGSFSGVPTDISTGKMPSGKPPLHHEHFEDAGIESPVKAAWQDTVGQGGGSLTLQVDTNGFMEDESQIETPRVNLKHSTTGALPPIPKSRIPRQTWPIVIERGGHGRRTRRPAPGDLNLEEI